MTVNQKESGPSGSQQKVANAHPSQSKTGLRGSLGVISLLFIVVAFNGPMAVLTQYIPVIVAFGNGLGVPLTFAVLGCLVFVFSIGLNAMARRMTHPGGFYTYIAAGLGRPLGLAGGIIALVAYLLLGTGAFAMLAIAFQHLLQDTFGMRNVPEWWLIALVGWAITSTLSLFNVDFSAKILGTLAVLEITIALIWNANVYIQGGPEGRSFDILGSALSGSVAIAVIFVTTSFTGFESLQVFRSESKNPEKTVPRATYISVILLGVLYISSSYAYIISYGASNAVAAGADDPTGAMLGSIARFMGGPSADIANCLLVTSLFAACLAIQNIAARYLFSLGRDGVLPRRLGQANPTHGSPMTAAVVAAVVTFTGICLSALTGLTAVETFTYWQGVGGYCLIALWVVTCLAVVVFFRRNPSEHANPWKVVVAPIVALLGLGGVFGWATANFSELVGGNTALSYIALSGITVIAVAAVLGAAWFRKYRPQVYERIGKQDETLMSDS